MEPRLLTTTTVKNSNEASRASHTDSTATDATTTSTTPSSQLPEITFRVPDVPKIPTPPSTSSTSSISDPPQNSTTAAATSDHDLDVAPAFPMPDGPQSASGPASTRPAALAPSSSLSVASTRSAAAAAGGGGGNAPRISGAAKPVIKRNKVALEPGHSPLDWAALKTSGKDLRGVQGLARYTRDDLQKHVTPDDAWCALHGKVYNMTAYLKFHPGGVDQLMRVAGRDATKLFMATHSWVNADYLLDNCMVGFFVPN